MVNIMSLDVGDKRVGIALGTVSPKTFSPFAVVERAQGKAEQKILELLTSKGIEQLVVGLPLSEDGAVNEQCIKIEKFCLRIQRRCKVSIVFVDEFATSLEASERLAGFKKLSLVERRKKQALDAISASIILESYLNYGQQVVVKEDLLLKEKES